MALVKIYQGLASSETATITGFIYGYCTIRDSRPEHTRSPMSTFLSKTIVGYLCSVVVESLHGIMSKPIRPLVPITLFASMVHQLKRKAD